MDREDRRSCKEILDASLLVSLLLRVSRPCLASLYISKSTACKTSSATRGSREDRAPCALGARGFVPSKMVHTDHASLYFPCCALLPSIAVDPIVRPIRDICPFNRVSRLDRFYTATTRSKHTRPVVVLVSRSKVLRDFFETIAGSSLSGCQVFSRVTLCFT